MESSLSIDRCLFMMSGLYSPLRTHNPQNLPRCEWSVTFSPDNFILILTEQGSSHRFRTVNRYVVLRRSKESRPGV